MSRQTKWMPMVYFCTTVIIICICVYIVNQTDYTRPKANFPVLKRPVDYSQSENSTITIVPPLHRNISGHVNMTGTEYFYNPVKANCSALVAGNTNEISRVTNLLSHWRMSPNEHVYELLSDCKRVKTLFRPDNFFVSKEELEFPLAYSILFHSSPQQILKFLTVTYRPHNFYCLNPDLKSDKKMITAFVKFASCFDNVFVPKELVSVTYRHISTVDAHLHCLRELLTKGQWKYVMLLCGKEIPVTTNAKMVEAFKKSNGSSLMDVHKIPEQHYRERFLRIFKLNNDGKIVATRRRKKKIPGGVQIYKSYSYIGASRAFIDFILTDKLVQELYDYMSTVLMPDEEFYATAYMLPNAPKGKIGPQANLVKAFWAVNSKSCTRKEVHGVCILNIEDLPQLFKIANGSPLFFFFNKYFMEFDHVVMECFEDRIVKLNQEEGKRLKSSS